jgi:hypothetical protein
MLFISLFSVRSNGERRFPDAVGVQTVWQTMMTCAVLKSEEL